MLNIPTGLYLIRERKVSNRSDKKAHSNMEGRHCIHTVHK